MSTKNTKYNSEITKEDLKTLGDKSGNLRNDNSDDELLKNKVNNTDFTGKDLDIPGRKPSIKTNKKSLKDEENQHYSLGSDDNENLEIDTIN
ncbi:hypothetical protein BW723_12220 [Polaribacter reichenbachii]|uniref:Uncharacterized protein n=1 Tax=Polaribacter reichenbachii TaxID=996801 RepID=A0A1B8TPD4_9FLAO|nr:hypothetical protein [Polaribacter reichenbachii]APZ47002.1 hypothetical protein BW723_12220 [Polaribacter reichenbachii]AUC17645.1 hypothetical protein BTO17_02670 [Polaribacter reichenbachii]OBY61482.1 hypothetical protein LPB301_15555 [Polaribacter reichenbachii]